jgi:hypothetical protein
MPLTSYDKLKHCSAPQPSTFKKQPARPARAFSFLAPCYILPIRRIIKPILLGLLIGTLVMAGIYGSAVLGSTPSVNLLLKMTLPPFNLAATLVEPVAPDDLERGGQMLDTLLMVAWLQISLLSAVAVAAIRAIFLKHRQ